MRNATKKAAATTTLTVTMSKSQYGCPQPQIEIWLPRAANHRALSAELHQLAAKVELATPAHERWVVETGSIDRDSGRVYLELVDATPAEAQRGLAMLKQIAG